jgi:hypothetical protein
MARCRLVGDDPGREFELPAWMLERERCVAMHLTEHPAVCWQALSELCLLCQEIGQSGDRHVIQTRHVFSLT